MDHFDLDFAVRELGFRVLLDLHETLDLALHVHLVRLVHETLDLALD